MKYPVKGKITSKYGNRIHPVTGVKKFHNGIDIAAPTGTHVLAPASGKVINRYYNSTGGNQLIIKHDNGFQTGYAHLHKIHVSVGDRVEQGELIAEVGNTGASTGAHLHLTMRKNGVLVDPLEVLS